ncbi:MAG: efflux RND transporter periplasmic adaptor subunit [Verrucomicrobiota bacterium JB022]|nr:efflux RND transporter periplasmic adaptor subunit [Verrucomicrobiota bacterium JB022]
MKINRLFVIGGAAALLALGLLLGRALAPDAGHSHAPAGHSEDAAGAKIWTCSMHPQIRQPEPGDCPICGMDLIPLVEDSEHEAGPRAMQMSESALGLAEVQTQPVERRFPTAKVRLVGTLEYDETQVRSLTARFPARIERLYVNYTGVEVAKGEHLAEVYSPELLTAQRELLTASRVDPQGPLARASREKLRLWDLLPEQIDAILADGEASDHIELRAPISGVVGSRNVNEGSYVQTGQSLFTIVDLGHLWLQLNAYESDLPALRYGQEVQFTVQAYPGETFTGTISFIEPVLDRKTRTVPVRVNVPNEDGRLKPGMFARGVVEARLAADGRAFSPDLAGKWISPMHPEIVKDGPGQCDICGMDLVPAESLGFVDTGDREAPLVVPSSAVLQTGTRAVVYVRLPDTERPTFEGREIVLGPKAGNDFIVNEGLQEGDQVVTQGAFKIDSALQIQAKPSMMNPKGDAPAPGHNHGQAAQPTRPHTHDAAGLSLDAASAQQLLPGYLKLQQALANDDLKAAQASLRSLMQVTGHTGAPADLVHAMLGAESLDALRKPHFDTLSAALITALQAQPEAAGETLYVMHCPMVYGDHGADWLQASDQLRNPYFGAMMLKCGEVKAKIE